MKTVLSHQPSEEKIAAYNRWLLKAYKLYNVKPTLGYYTLAAVDIYFFLKMTLLSFLMFEMKMFFFKKNKKKHAAITN